MELKRTKYSFSDFLVEKLQELFPKDSETYLNMTYKIKQTVRVNLLKTTQKDLMKKFLRKGVEVVKDGKHILVIENNNNVPIGATPEYLCGEYTIQSISSTIPVLNLDIKKNMKILDICAAPGGKSTFIGEFMQGGFLQCNEINENRIPALRSNIQRCGIKNVYITNFDGRKLNTEQFDRILLDTPCSGTGVLDKHTEVHAMNKDMLNQITHKQKDLILKVFDKLKVGGYLVYSTCSVLIEENESIVQYLMDKREGVKLEPVTGIINNIDLCKGYKKFKLNRFSQQMERTARVFPHIHFSSGFFIAKIKRTK